MQFTIVNAVAFVSADVFCATKVEKRGESAITTMPQNSKKPINKFSDSDAKISGETKQQPQDKSNAINAIRFVPSFCDRYPPITQATPPIPIMKNDHNGMLNAISG